VTTRAFWIAPTLFSLWSLLAWPGAGQAQDTWTFEQSGGVALTTQDLGDADLGLGYGFAGTVGYRIAGPFSVYAGWSWFRFHADESFAGPDIEVDRTGFLYGLELRRPVGSRPMLEIQARLGLTYEQVDLEPEGSGDALEAGWEVGWGLGVVVAFRLGEHWRIGPALSYRALSPVFPTEPAQTGTDLTHLSLGVAFARRF
jgi:hypothetical protein